MKKILSLVLLSALLLNVTAQTREEESVAAAVVFLVKALESGDRAALEKISSAELSYGHSSGLVETRSQFVDALSSGQSDFVNINISNQTLVVTGKNAIVRHRLDATTQDRGKSGEAHLNILLVFRKEQGQWKLLARQAAKIVG
jgi:ketosteroid isomerase-like protein